MNSEKIHHPETPERAPLKREAPRPLKSPGKIPEAVLDIIEKHSEFGFDQNTGFHGGPSARRKGYKLALWSCLASLIDGLILISLSSFFMMAFALVVKTPLGAFFQETLQSQHRLWLFAQIFAGAGWMYLIAVRAFMGATVGEWACELRLGQPQERLRASYIWRVLWRSTLIVATGVLTLPMVSLLIGRDVAGVLSGLRLFSLK